MSTPIIEIELPPSTRAFIARFQKLPQNLVAAIQRGMDAGVESTLSRIQSQRLTGQGPFPVEDHRLGVRSGKLRQSLRRSPAVVEGGGDKFTVSAAIGTPIKYARIHEFGGEIKRTVKPGNVRLRTDKKGQLLRNGGLAVFARSKGDKAHKRYREVSFAGGKTYTIHIPARAPIGHGVADNAGAFTAAITREINRLRNAT